jgi:hypothetical protein
MKTLTSLWANWLVAVAFSLSIFNHDVEHPEEREERPMVRVYRNETHA